MAERVLSLPVSADLAPADQETVAQSLLNSAVGG
jgi:dTDP-4-amino-4,6-dideoxygalactose transaminase